MAANPEIASITLRLNGPTWSGAGVGGLHSLLLAIVGAIYRI